MATEITSLSKEALFLKFSVEATGFSAFDLTATGQTQLYFNTVRDEIGDEELSEFVKFFASKGIQATLNHSRYGDISRNIIKLWFIATWHKPQNSRPGAGATRIVSPNAYPEGLVWRTIGANPPGAKAKGYQSWSEKPKTSLDIIPCDAK